ncbi:Glycosyltransferase involved in cell wall bisynthesis [Rhodoblastus acidophilus]|uniref:Glycosyltransferase involved in cell wall bisynthesis n=1 Tax=Rhodoblastus acidophilus TaxID=1074 RepID=A0A212Q7W5_RHOAC|nr:glycosyltransferase family 2 protein [Rhodoblastus acidophilus]MCW2316496.1 glycosyltransferase involved in cell wall biosynthesis [Rhodoblastus acidophilus]PPQ35877.1 glycosyltransferase family 2 protein [Rhodoblastus acidophilus]RAI17329.1 glycosyltransferase family 2 protein [Rhodoblastus acidophilus]SNB55417.1 Glycosyltransferase involved in cell wall bisynthesis [Rhodoblastus acidophilus]
MSRLPVAATVICKNEEACIGACLASLADCAQIVVVDSGSTDRTLAIVEDFSARGWPIELHRRDWPGYAKQKQFALEQAREAWILSIDADEWLDDVLRADLPRLLAAPEEVGGWRLPRVLTLYGETEPPPPSVKPDHILRLVRRGRAHFDATVLVHEGLVVEGGIRDANTGLLRHERGLRLDAQLPKEILYARLKAEQRIAAGKKPSVLKLVFNPPLYFFRIFVTRRVFLCGAPGFIHAMTGAIYSFIAEALHFQMAREKPKA